MLHYNTKEVSQERQQTKPLNLQEEELVVTIFNEMLNGNWVRLKEEKELLQQFVNNYQNLNHYKATTVGLWATDRPDLLDEEKGFHWQL